MLPGGVGISISASNVYLNLRGRTISGPGCSDLPTSVGIVVAASDVHITNGTAKALTIGIQVASEPGFPAEHNHLSHLTLRENCTGLGVRANDNHVNSSTISANAAEGVVLTNSNHNVIDSNVINDNDPPGGGVAGGGLLIQDNSDDNTITSNQFSRNGNFGVYIPTAGGSHNTIRGNNVKDTRNGAGIDVRDDNNTIRENKLTGNGSGIQLLTNTFTSGNFLYRNRALRNLPGFDLRDTDCQNNTWTNNIFETDDEMGSGAGPDAGCIQ